MKKFLSAVLALSLVAVGHAQQSRKTEVKESRDKYANQEVSYRKVAHNGKTLYQRGDCISMGPRTKICTFCDNEALTENCREYECDNKGWPLRLRPKEKAVGEKAATNERPRAEDPDQGGEIDGSSTVDIAEVVTRKKKTDGVTMVYSNAGKHTVYANFKQGKVDSYFAIDINGKNIPATYTAAKNGVKCYFCIVSDGKGDTRSGKVCYEVKCEDIPSPASSSTILRSRQ